MFLVGLELGADFCLYGLRLHFTDGISSPYIQASHAKLQAYEVYTFAESGPKLISEVCIDQDAETGNIFGLKIIDDSGDVFVHRSWRKPNVGDNTWWKSKWL